LYFLVDHCISLCILSPVRLTMHFFLSFVFTIFAVSFSPFRVASTVRSLAVLSLLWYLLPFVRFCVSDVRSIKERLRLRQRRIMFLERLPAQLLVGFSLGEAGKERPRSIDGA
jgi:hypothetical protein